MPSATYKKNLPIPKVPADIDDLIKRFKELFGRDLTREELSHLEYAKELLAGKESC